jgi:hypothetical protein
MNRVGFHGSNCKLRGMAVFQVIQLITRAVWKTR